MKIKSSIGDNIFQLFNYVFCGIFSFLCIYPFYYILIYSLSIPKEAAKGNMFLLPAGFTLQNYTNVLKVEGTFNAFFISVSRAILGTIITVVVTGLFAYVLTKRNLPWRKFFYRFAISSMYISAGLIPSYITMTKLGFKNNYLIYIIPGAVSAYFLILIKTYIESIPASLEESAYIDGAGFFTVFFKILFPVCMPVIAAVAVFSAVGHWNSWGDTLIYVDNKKLWTLQFKLMRVLREADLIAQKIRTSSSGSMSGTSDAYNSSNLKVELTPTSIRMTITMVTTIPILLVYPTMQKYFVKGIMMGAIKG